MVDMDLLVVAESVDSSTWTAGALCKGKTHLFYGSVRERPGRRRRREAIARSYCQVCRVLERCREAGRQNRENGVWGGENEEQRSMMGYPPRTSERRSVAAAARAGRDAA